MKFILCIAFFLVANAPQNVTIELEAYITELVKMTVLTDEELLVFEETLTKGEITNPIDCEKKHCDSIKKLHHDNFEEILKEKFSKSDLQTWLRNFLDQRSHNHDQRKDTKKNTFSLWRPKPFKRIDNTCAIQKNGEGICWGAFFHNKIEVPKNLGPIKQLINPELYTVALKEDGSVHCWGDPKLDQCDVPENLDRVIQIAADSYHMCALEEKGTVKCWGANNVEQVSVPPLERVVKISVSRDYSCALEESGSVKCWGKVHSVSLGPAMDLSTGYDHICIVDYNGELQCAGQGMQNIKVEEPIVQIASGTFDLCVLFKSGRVKCFGLMENRIDTTLLDSGNLVQIHLDHGRIWALTRNGKLKCVTAYFARPIYPIPEDLEISVDDLLPYFDF